MPCYAGLQRMPSRQQLACRSARQANCIALPTLPRRPGTVTTFADIPFSTPTLEALLLREGELI